MDTRNPKLCNLIRISSGSATSKNSNSDFSVDLGNQPFSDRITCVALKTVIFPNCFYNIRAGVNDAFAMQENNQAKIIFTIPEGFYDVTTLMTQLQTDINANLNAGSVTVTQNSVSGKIVITASGQTIKFFNYTDGTTMANEIGFSVSSTTYVSSYTATYMPQLQGLTEVFLVSSMIAPAHMIDSDNKLQLRNVIMSIPITADFGDINIYEARDENLNVIHYANKKSIRNIDIQLQDSQGNVVNLQNNNLKIIFKAYYNATN